MVKRERARGCRVLGGRGGERGWRRKREVGGG